MTIREAYATLGLDASSTTPDEARSRFRNLIRSNHPDGKPSNERVRANESTRVIVEACTVLRTNGFPRVLTYNRTADVSGARDERPTPAEPEYADRFAWVYQMWNECLRSNLVCAASPAFGVYFALGAWTTACEIMWGKRR